MRVAITGVGAVGFWGNEYSAFTSQLTNPELPNKVATVPELDFFTIVGTKNKRTKKMERLSRIVSIAAKGAMELAGLKKDDVAPGRGAVVTGSSFGALDSILTFHRQLETDGASSVNPNVFPPTSHNVAGGHLSIEFGFSGPLIHFASGSLSSEQALLYGYDLIRTGRADVVITGGWDILCEDLLKSFALPTEISANPLSPSSKSFLPAEGAALVVLESEEHAQKRAAQINAWLEGGSVWSDNHFAKGKETLKNLDCKPSDFSHVCLSANGIADKDERESSWLRKLFLEAEVAPPAIIIPRQSTGDTFGANGAFNLVSAVAHFAGVPIKVDVPNPSVPGAGYFQTEREDKGKVLLSNLTASDEAALLVVLPV